MGTSGFDDRNIIGAFDIAAHNAYEGSWASMLAFMNSDSDRATEEYGILGANSEMREWVGARQEQILRKKTYEISNAKYESTLVIPSAEVDRDKSGLLQARMDTFAVDTVAGHWESLVTALINNNGDCYDDQSFFDTDHLWGDSGTQKNEVTASEISALNVTTATAPTPAEASRAILGMVGHLLTLKNDKGRLVNGNARSFQIQVSTVDLYAPIVQAIASERLSESGQIDNPLRGLTQKGFKFDVRLNPDITSATAKIHLFRTDGPLGPFILQDEKAPSLSILGPGSDFYFDNDAYKLGVSARRGAGYGFWEYALRGTLS